MDIGGYATDVLPLRSGKPDMQFCRSLETGVITMNYNIIRRVGALHDMQIKNEHIAAVLTGKETICPEDVKKTIRNSAQEHAKYILNSLRELKVDLRANPTEAYDCHTDDRYTTYERIYYVGNLQVAVHDETLGDVLQYLVPAHRNVILLSIAADMQEYRDACE